MAPAPSSIAAAAPAKTHTVHYGWQVFAVDAASLGLIYGASKSDNMIAAPLQTIAAAGAIVGGPIVHLAHRQWGRAGLSFAMRLGAPLLLAALASCKTDSDPGAWYPDHCGNALSAAAAGYILAAGIDALFLAHKTETVRASGLSSLQPSLQIGASGARAGFSFTF